MKLKHLLSTLLVGSAMAVTAANPIPPDPAVRIGKLDNGLTYYIRRNATPAGQADFFIAQRVGSINELDNQQGLAHFLEHMCFNGTEHFPGNSLITYLEGLGVKFGRNLNAYTSTDETVYNICAVPTARPSALDSCVMILADWSGRLLLNDADIDAERGVIMGEMRQRSTPGSRILTAVAPKLYQGVIYGERMPIGKADIVANFSHDALRDYYHKWYHPANQAVVIVGDIDPDAMEQAVSRHFSGFAPGAGAAVATPVEIPDNAEPVYALATDPEQAEYMVQLYFKNPPLPEGAEATIDEVRRDYIRRLISSMLVERLDAIEATPGCPWSSLGIADRRFLLSSTRDALLLRANASDSESARRTIALLTAELQRAARHGFTATELERAKLTDRADRERAMANAGKEKTTDLARRYATHFTRGGIIPSTEQLYKMMKGVERTLTPEMVNDYFASVVTPDGRNSLAVVYAPASTDLTEGQIAAQVASVDVNALEPFVDTFANRPLMASLPEPGRIVDEQPGKFGTTLLTLSNGIRVYLRPSAEKPDQVIIHGVSPGGLSIGFDPAQKGNYKLVDDILAVSAYGGHSSVDLRKLLAGHNVKSAVKIGNTSEEISAVTTPDDLTTAFQLLYLKATAPGRDDNAFGALMASNRSKLSNPSPTATIAMGDTIHSYVYRHHPLGEKLRLADLDAVDYDSIMALHSRRFGDMTDFTFVITGNFSTDSIRPLLERYVASLPAAGRRERARDFGYGFASGNTSREFTHPMPDMPQTIVYSFYNSECPYNLENVLTAGTLGSILKNRLRDEVREKRGLTYSITSHCSVTAGFNGPDTPARMILPVYIKVKPGHHGEVYNVIDSTIATLAAEGPTADELAAIKAFMLKDIEENRRDNAYWDTVIRMYEEYGRDMDSDYEAIVERMTPATIRDFADRYLRSADRMRLTMLPAGE